MGRPRSKLRSMPLAKRCGWYSSGFNPQVWKGQQTLMEDLLIATAQFEHRSGDKQYNLSVIRKLAEQAALGRDLFFIILHKFVISTEGVAVVEKPAGKSKFDKGLPLAKIQRILCHQRKQLLHVNMPIPDPRSRNYLNPAMPSAFVHSSPSLPWRCSRRCRAGTRDLHLVH